MRKKFTGRQSLPLITLLSCLNLPLLAQSTNPIGVVLTTKGQVQARNTAGVVRQLSRKSEIFEKDTILVGGDGAAQLRMNDDARIALVSNTEFTFDQYSFDDNPATPDTAAMSMVKGGFRTISGQVGHGKGDNYHLDTPMATIGIRGSFHEGVITGDSLFTWTGQGGTTVSNSMGTTNLGLGGSYDYSRTQQNQAPQGLLLPPQQLIQLNTAFNTTNSNGSNANNGNGNGNNNNATQSTAGNGSTTNQNNNTSSNPPASSLDNLGGGTAGSTQNQAGSNTTPITTGLTTNLVAFGTTPNAPLPGNDTGSNINPALNSRNTFELIVDSGGTAPSPPPPPPAPPPPAPPPPAPPPPAPPPPAPPPPAPPPPAPPPPAPPPPAPPPPAPPPPAPPPPAPPPPAPPPPAPPPPAPPPPAPPPPPTPVLSTAELSALQSNPLRLGLYLDRYDLMPSIALGLTNNDPAHPFLVVTDPNAPTTLPTTLADSNANDLIYRSTSAFDFGTDIESYNGKISFDVGGGETGNSTIQLFTNNANRASPAPTTLATNGDGGIWLSAAASSLSAVNAINATSSSQHYMNFEDGVGRNNQDLNIDRLRISVDVTDQNEDHAPDHLTGNVRFCSGGGSSCFSQGDNWQFNFNGSIKDGVATASSSGDMLFDGASYSLNSNLKGFFTGTNAEGFAAGFNLATAANNGTSIEGLFLLEKENRFTNAEYMSLDKDSLLVQQGFSINFLGGMQSGNTNATDALFMGYNGVVLRDSRTGLTLGGLGTSRNNLTITTPTTPGATITPYIYDPASSTFGVTWEKWSGPLMVLNDNQDNTDFVTGTTMNPQQNFDQNGKSANNIAFVSKFNISDVLNQRGHFSQVLGFVGQGDAGTAISSLNMSFDVDFSASLNNITNGILSLDVGSSNENWQVLFEGNVTDNKFFFSTDPQYGGIIQSRGSDATRLKIGSTTGNFSTFAGILRGAFVDNGSRQQGVVASFYFKDLTSNTGSALFGQTVEGEALSFGFIENRVTAAEQANLTQFGFAIPRTGFNYSTSGGSGILPTIIPVLMQPGDASLLVEAGLKTSDGEGGWTTDYSQPILFPDLNSATYSHVIRSQGAGEGTNPADNGFGDHDGIDYPISMQTLNPTVPNSSVISYRNGTGDLSSQITEPVLVASVGTTPLSSPKDSGNVTFARVVEFTGQSSTANGAFGLSSVKAYFDLSGGSYGSTNGYNQLEICAGTSNVQSCGTAGNGDLFKLNFSGSTASDHSGWLSGNPSSVTLTHNGSTTTIFSSENDGSLAGIFTGAVQGTADAHQGLYDAFVGGFNFDDPNDPSLFLTGAFVLEREDRLDGAALQFLTDPEYSSQQRTALVRAVGLNSVALMAYAPHSDGGDTYHPYFIGDLNAPAQSASTIGSNFLSGNTVISFANPGTDEVSLSTNVGGYYGFNWGRWDNALAQVDNLANTHSDSSTTLTDPLYWSVFVPATLPTNRTGHFKTIDFCDGSCSSYGLLAEERRNNGESITGVAIDKLDLQFDVNFHTATISAGTLSMESHDHSTWNGLTFNGSISNGQPSFTFQSSENVYGLYTSPTAATSSINAASLSGAFLVDASDPDFQNNPAMVGNFNLSASGANAGVAGQFLAKSDTLVSTEDWLEEFRQNLDTNFTALGILQPSNTGEIHHAFVATRDDQNNTLATTDRVFAEFASFSNADDLPSTVDSDNEINYVYRRNNAADVTHTSVAGYNVDWGIWGSGVQQFGTSNDLSDVSTYDNNVVWAIMKDHSLLPEAPTGTFTYAATKAFIADTNYSTGSLAVNAVNLSFDVDFSCGFLKNGHLDVVVDPGSGNSDQFYHWDSTFNASISHGYIVGEYLYGSIHQKANPGYEGSFNGELSGRFLTGTATDKYNAVLSGFNLYSDSGEGYDVARYINGMALVERDDRFYDPTVDDSYSSNLINHLLNANAKAIVIGSSGPDSSTEELASYLDSDCYFKDEDQVTFLDKSKDQVFRMWRYDNNIEHSQFADSAGNRVAMGFWESPESTPAILTNNLDANETISLGDSGMWMTYTTPINFSNYQIGRFSRDYLEDHSGYNFAHYVNNNLTICTATCDNSTGFEVGFDVNFTTGAIQNGKMKITASDNVWDVTFSGGTFKDNSVVINNPSSISGTLTAGEGGTPQAINASGNVIAGAFLLGDDEEAKKQLVFSGMYKLGAVVGSDQHKIYGDFQTGGYTFDYLDVRLPIGDLVSLESSDQVGMIVSPTAGIAWGKAVSAYAGTVPILTHNGFNQGPADANFLKADPAQVVLTNINPCAGGESPAIENLDWGRWDAADTKVMEDATSSSSVPALEELFWAVFKPDQYANVTGTYSCGGAACTNVIGHGSSTLTDVRMQFDVSLTSGSGDITGGNLKVTENNSHGWDMNFNGHVTHGFVNMNMTDNVTSHFGTDSTELAGNTVTATGKISGAFVQSSGPAPAFVSGFALQSGLNNVQGMTVTNLQPITH